MAIGRVEEGKKRTAEGAEWECNMLYYIAAWINGIVFFASQRHSQNPVSTQSPSACH